MSDVEQLVAQESVLPEGVPPLTTFYLYLVTGCNLACRHCWITPTFYKGQPSAGDCMDFDLLKAAVQEAKLLGLSSAKLTGGEPTLHPQFREIVDYLSAEKIGLTMETNATLITPELAKHLRENSTMWFISSSIDGATAKTHDWFRAVPGAFDAAWRGIDHLVAAGFRPQVIMSPYHGNRAEIDEVVRQAIEHGAGSVKFNPVMSSGRGKAMEKRGETFGPDEVIELAKYIRGDLQSRTPIPLTIGIPPAFSTIADLLRDEGTGGSCGIRNIIGLLGNGEMALCGIGRNIPDLTFGIMGKDSIRDVWINHPTLVQLRKDLNSQLPGICGDCIHASRCMTHCAAYNYLDSGQLIHPSKLCHVATERGEFPASRRKSSSVVEIMNVL